MTAVLNNTVSSNNSIKTIDWPRPSKKSRTGILHAAIIGMDGFAKNHHNAIHKLERTQEVSLQATCDPRAGELVDQQQKWDLSGRGVRIFDDYLSLLDTHQSALDFVTLPTPLPLHAPMHRACVERGLACYLEKPPTLYWAELEAMIEVDERARFATQVGFNFIVEAPRQTLKRRLLSGEFGALRRVGFVGSWPRNANYFLRAPWAGRLMQSERLVLDSCVGNAMAHHIHNLLFWCGQSEVLSWAKVLDVEAELYRAHAIESFDTCFARGRCVGDVEIYVAATHTGNGGSWHHETIECEHATITYNAQQEYSIHWRDGREEHGEADKRELLVENLRHYVRYLRGEEERPLTRLEDTRPFVHFNNLLFIAAGGIASIPENHLQRTRTKDREWIEVEGMAIIIKEFAQNRCFPSERGPQWAQPGGQATIAELSQLELVVRGMKERSEQPEFTRV